MAGAASDNSSTASWLLAAGGPPDPGELGLVTVRRGEHGSALLAHLAFEALSRGQRVLHVVLRESVEDVGARYSAVSLQHAAHEVSRSADADRRRMVLSYAGRTFDVAHLAAHLTMLVDTVGFEPDLLLVDGLELAQLERDGAALLVLGTSRRMVSWWSVELGPSALSEEMAAVARTRVQLDPMDDGARLSVYLSGTKHRLPWSVDRLSRLRSDLEDRPVKKEDANQVEAHACTLFSGGATGSETAFGEAAARFGAREVHFTFDGHRQARTEGRKILTPQELEAGDVSLVYVSRRLHRTYNEHGLIRKVLQTLWHMVSRSQQVFVVGAIQENGTVVGGTGWSVELARMWRKDLWVFDQVQDGWFHWDGELWTPGHPEIRSANICGSGTRYLEDNGQQAIDDLFASAFGQ
jgi:hypothetical protein